MITIVNIDDVYPAVEELIVMLKSRADTNLGAIFDHRMHSVHWTTRAELLGELRSIAVKALKEQSESLGPQICGQLKALLRVTEEFY